MAEARLGEPIGVEDMAEAACYSPYYFSRLFAQATGHSPYDYLMRRRVASAAELLIGGRASIIEIALDCGFEAPDSFTRAFRRCFGVPPSEARKTGCYPRAIARTRIERTQVEAMLAAPPPAPEATKEADAVIMGSWSELPWADPLHGSLPSARAPRLILVERGGSLEAKRTFIGQATEPRPPGAEADIPPAYPLSASLVSGGRRARFRIEGGYERLDFVVEYAYRSWLPLSGRTKAPSYDIIEEGGDGRLALVLPLIEDSGSIPCPS